MVLYYVNMPIQYISSSDDRHLGCLEFLVTVSCADMKMHVCAITDGISSYWTSLSPAWPYNFLIPNMDLATFAVNELSHLSKLLPLYSLKVHLMYHQIAPYIKTICTCELFLLLDCKLLRAEDVSFILLFPSQCLPYIRNPIKFLLVNEGWLRKMSP